MKKISTVVTDRIEIFKEHKLTIGLDLGDRFSHYCVLDEAGEVIPERRFRRRRKESTKCSERSRAVGSR